MRFYCRLVFAIALSAMPVRSWAAALSIEAPPGHKVEPDTPETGYTEALAVSSTLDDDAGCGIAFQPFPDVHVTQDALNKIAATPAFLTTVKNTLGLKFDVTAVEPFALGDVQGAQVRGTGKGAPEVSTLSTLVQTPRGRTVVSCIGPTARFDTLKPEFDAITRGVRPPR